MESPMKAYDHPAYNASLQHAAKRAFESKDACFTVYFDDERIYVRASVAAPPPNSKIVCIAQFWGGSTVQLRFSGGESQWAYF